MDNFPPLSVLTIGGSDPGGGAGIQADLRMFNYLAVYGFSAITAITSQNTREVKSVLPLSKADIDNQLAVIVEDAELAATKTGMLATAAAVEAVAEFVENNNAGVFVIDPVIMSTTGAPLLDDEGVELLRSRLMPLCRVITPNLAEAQVLTGIRIEKPEHAGDAAKKLVAMGARAACVTGGHWPGVPVDVLYDGREIEIFEGTRSGEGVEFHGTGCLFSAALTCYLARGRKLSSAIADAKRLVQAAIAGSVRSGGGMRVPWLGVRLEPGHLNH
ncbi:MAG: bifunctional hydroxymethylpyrimidine kinase/phosphomethylpyrimidine kinase [Thermoleophilia bacterium]|jgi:hydroxymethylpyrimidine/phosphomethylpyrimidine kinase